LSLSIINMFAFLKHLFIPRYTNNHRAKILHNSSIALLAIFLLMLGVFSKSFSQTHPDVLGISYSISADDLLSQVNKIRIENNVSPLTMNSSLAAAAKSKAEDMLSKNYWAHFAPDGSTSPWVFIKDSGYGYVYAGENLAKGYTDSQSVVSAWMNSPTHKANIISPNYKDIGFAIVQGRLLGEETVLVVQLFGSTLDVQANKNMQETTSATEIAGVKSQELVVQPQLDIRQTAKTFSLVLFSLLFITFVFDFAITKTKKLPRLVGHNLDHIILIIIFVTFILIQNEGGIL